MRSKRMLIGCECSGAVRDSFRAMGFDAWSCDLKPCERGSAFHIQGDVIDAIMQERWLMIGLHPDCTAMAVSGNRWYGTDMPMHSKRLDAITFTSTMWGLAKAMSKHVYLENPVGVLFKNLNKEVLQYIQPWQFGHGEMKKTGLALHGLPKLEPTNIVAGREQKVWKEPPGPNRKANRSRTYQGIADAMADQWSKVI